VLENKELSQRAFSRMFHDLGLRRPTFRSLWPEDRAPRRG
jgi:hypothetical protein